MLRVVQVYALRREVCPLPRLVATRVLVWQLPLLRVRLLELELVVVPIWRAHWLLLSVSERASWPIVMMKMRKRKIGINN